MSNLYSSKDTNIRKTWILMMTFFIVVIGLGWLFGYILDNYLVFFGAVIFSVIMNIGSYWFSDRIVLAVANAHPLEQNNSSHREIQRLVDNLAITAGLPSPRVFLIKDSALNAFATGRNPEHGVIALTEGIVARLDKVELEGVIAHELSHIGNRDTLIQTVSVILVGLVALISDWFFHLVFRGRSDRENGSSVVVLGIAMVLAILAPIFVQLLHLAISRKREYLADASAALLTRYPDGLARALAKISNDPHILQSANRATAHLFISNPLKQNGIQELFSTHPPILKRIEALTGIDVLDKTKDTKEV